MSANLKAPTGWRRLRRGEIIRQGDKIDQFPGGWAPCRATIGTTITDSMLSFFSYIRPTVTARKRAKRSARKAVTA